MTRSLKKGAFVDGHLMEKVEDLNPRNENKEFDTGSRCSKVIPEFI